jgi:hypothetical protein
MTVAEDTRPASVLETIDECAEVASDKYVYTMSTNIRLSIYH